MAIHATCAFAGASAAASMNALLPHNSSMRNAMLRRSFQSAPCTQVACNSSHPPQPSSRTSCSPSVTRGVQPRPARVSRRRSHPSNPFGSLSRHSLGSAPCNQQRKPRWVQGWGLTPCAAVKQEQLQPGQSKSSDSGGGLDRIFSNITGFPFPIGPNFVRRTIRFEVQFPTLPPASCCGHTCQ